MDNTIMELKASLLASTLLKYRQNSQSLWGGYNPTRDYSSAILENGTPRGLTKRESTAIYGWGFAQYEFDDDQLEVLRRAHCIRQQLLWQAPGTAQEIADEVVTQLKLAATSERTDEEDFGRLDYYLKALRLFPQHWGSPTVEDAVVHALARVSNADKLYRVSDEDFVAVINAEENKWAIQFFDDPTEYHCTELQAAVDAFCDTCEEIIKVNHATKDTVYRKRDASEMEEGLGRIAAPSKAEGKRPMRA